VRGRNIKPFGVGFMGMHPSATRTKNKLAIIDICRNSNLYIGKDRDMPHGVCTINKTT
jgi:hypothetical protein